MKGVSSGNEGDAQVGLRSQSPTPLDLIQKEPWKSIPFLS